MSREKLFDIAVPVFVYGAYVPAIILTTCVLGGLHLILKATANP